MKATPLLLITIGVLILWLGINGRLGMFLASLFTPKHVLTGDDL